MKKALSVSFLPFPARKEVSRMKKATSVFLPLFSDVLKARDWRLA